MKNPTSRKVPRQDNRRKSSRDRGYTWDWEKERKAFLKANPYCVECARRGVVTLATVVDHIIPHRGNMELFWDMSNLQPLCEHDHNVKTGRGE